MSHRRVQITFIMDTVTHANIVRDAIETKLNSMNADIFNRDVTARVWWPNLTGKPIVRIHIRWKNVPKAREFRDWLKNKATSAVGKNWIQSGSRVTLHTCTHDDPTPSPCVIDEKWSKP